MNAHTPGPWMVDDEEHVRAPYPNHTPGISIARMTCFGAHDVHMAKESNARLIAAAPELLEALEECLQLLTDPDAGESEANAVEMRIRAVLRKAGGAQ